MDLSTQKLLEENLKVADKNGKPLLRVGLIFTIYFRDAYTKEKHDAIVRCFEFYYQPCGKYLQWEKNPNTFKYLPVKKISSQRINGWLEEINSSQSIDLWSHSGEKMDDAAFFNIACLGSAEWEKDLSVIRFSVPVSWLDEKTGNYIELAEYITREIKPIHGYGGYGFTNSPDSSISYNVEPDVFKLSKIFKCIEVDYPGSHALYVDDGIKSVNWLTVLGSEMLKKVGGKEKLINILGVEDYIYRPFDGGLIIQAGDKPCVGSKEFPVPDNVKKLNLALKSLRSQKIKSFGHAKKFPEEERFDSETSKQWLQRFDD